MDPAIADRLVALNRRFYREFAGAFSSSRARLNDGIVRCFEEWDAVDSLVDVGCGDARVGRAWRDGKLDVSWDPRRSRYVGIDASTELLAAATDRVDPAFRLIAADLATPSWNADLAGRFDHAVCFSTLHHIPSVERRAAFVRAFADLLVEGGHWCVSVWQILDRPRFADRFAGWDEVGIDPDAVDANDRLVEWRQGGRGLRYVHHFDRDELVKLLIDNGLSVDSVWSSDGRSGDLGLYCAG